MMMMMLIVIVIIIIIDLFIIKSEQVYQINIINKNKHTHKAVIYCTELAITKPNNTIIMKPNLIKISIH